MNLFLKKTSLLWYLLDTRVGGCGFGDGGEWGTGHGQVQLPGKGKQPIYVAVSVRNAVSYDPG